MTVKKKQLRQKHANPGQLRKVIVLLRADIMSGRQQLIGLFRYVKENSKRWQIILRTPNRPNPNSGKEITRDADGVIFSESEARNWIDELATGNIPTIAIDMTEDYFPESRPNVVLINVDNSAIGTLAARHLLSKGRPSAAAFVSDFENRNWAQQRATAFQSCMEQNGIPSFLNLNPDFSEHSLANWLRALPKPLAVMAAFDVKAVQVLAACKEAELPVPGQVTVVSVDNDGFYCDWTEPTLSSVEPDFENEGYRAAQELDRLMERPHTAKKRKTILLPPRGVVERESTAIIPPMAIFVRNMETFICNNIDKKLRVGDVIRSSGVSRRLADLRFKQVKGETINQCILRHKIEKAKQLLKSTDLSMGSIADLCGFPDHRYLTRVFKHNMSMTMRQYRSSGMALSGNQRGHTPRNP